MKNFSSPPKALTKSPYGSKELINSLVFRFLFCLLLSFFTQFVQAQSVTADIIPDHSGRVSGVNINLNCDTYCVGNAGGAGQATIYFDPAPEHALVSVVGFRRTNSQGGQMPINNTTDGNLYTQDWNYGGELTATFTPAASEIDVRSNDLTISSGDVTPIVNDNSHFGVQLLSSSTTRFFRIYNTGVGALGLTGTSRVAITGTNAGDFSVSTQPNTDRIHGGKNASFIIRFTPSALGTRTATVTIVNSDSNEGTYTFNIAGTGVSALPDINIVGNGQDIPDTYNAPSTDNDTDFGPRSIGSGAVTKTFTIENKGTGSLDLSTGSVVSFMGDAAADFSVVTQPTSPVSPNSSRTFQVAFTPSVVGTRNATLYVNNYSPTENPYTFSVRGTGTAGCTQVATATETMSWNGSVSSDWTNPCNWTPNGVPTQTNPVIISSTGGAVVIPTGTNAAAKSISLSGGLVNKASLTISQGSELRMGSTESTVTKFNMVQYATVTNNGLLILETSGGGGVNSTFEMSFDDNLFHNYGLVVINSTNVTPIQIGNNGANGPNATFNNYACATFANYSGSMLLNSVGTSSFNNAGLFRTSGNLGAVGTFTNQSGGVAFVGGTLTHNPITTNNGSVRVNVNPTATTMFTYNGTYNGTIEIFTDAGVSNSAGTYNQATNTFTPSSGLPAGSVPLYIKITSTANNCSYVVPIIYQNGCTQVATSTDNMGWNGSVSSDWTNPCNWTPNGVPGAGNVVLIQTSSTYPTIAAGVNASVKQVYMTGNSRLTVETGASLTAQNNNSGIYLIDNAQFINRGSTTVTNTNPNAQTQNTVYLAASTTTFDNYGTLTANGGQNYGGYFAGTFNNKTGATLTASGYRGVYIGAGGKIINESNATINATGSNIGLVLDGQNTTSSNSGTINSSKIEIVNATTFTNQNCGVIKTTGDFSMSGNSVFNNYGYANVGAELGHYTATTNNYGVLKYNSLFGSVNNTTNSVVVNNSTPIFTLGASYNGTVNGIFTNEAATTSAGTYNQTNNTFTPSGGLPTGSQTLYAKITPNTGGCFYVVPFTYTNAGQPDYSISTSGNNLVITDLTGTGETLDISQNGSNIRFNVAGKKFSLNNGTTTNFPADVPLSNLGSITVNTANGNDIIDVGAFSNEVLPSLTINGGTGDDQVNFKGDITFITNANLDVDLQNDDANPGVDAIAFAINANIGLQGTGAATLKVSKNVTFNNGSTLGTNNGNLTIEANQQASPTVGNFKGISMNSSTQMQVLGSGLLTVKGKGGNDASGSQVGIFLNSGGIIYGGSNTVTVVGNGGASSGALNYGIVIQGSTAKITSLGGAVTVEGTGGGTGSSIGNGGVRVSLSGQITSAGTGAVTITGRGGNLSTGDSNIGIDLQNSGKITSVGGSVTVNAYGGGSGTSQVNYGLSMSQSAEISAGGTGSVTITGEGGTATGFSNHGIALEGLITSAGGNIALTGKAGGGSSGTNGIYMSKQSLAPVSSITTEVNGGNITITTNSLRIVDSPDIRTNAASTVTLKPFTAGAAIDISFAPDGANAPLILSDSELDRISTGTLIIGDGTAGDITVGIGVTRPTSTNMQFISNGDVTISGGNINTGGGTLLLDPGASTKAVKPTFNGTDVTASTLSFATGDLQITLNGTTLGDGTGSTYSQLNVAGAVNLTGLNLTFAGSYTPVGGETFTIVSNDGTDVIVGTFNGLAQGATIPNFRGSSLTATISYTGGSDNNDVVITVASPTLADINIQGNGFDIANGDTSPRTEDGTDFGDIDISLTEPVVRSFTIQNTGTVDLIIPLNGITKSGASDFGIGHVSLPLTIAPSGTATFPVIIDASGNGQRTATISIQSNDSDESPYTFNVRTVGVSPEINITGLGQNILDGDITPSGLDDTDFGMLDVASGSVSHTFTIQNVTGASGNLQLNAGAISITGTHSSDFTVSAITLPATISAGQSTIFVVTFNPSALGLRTATVRIQNNDLGEGTYDFTVQGYGGKPFITTWKTDQGTVGNTITIPTKGTGYNYDVDWNNDGIFDQFGVTGNVTHNYDTPGTYTVAIRGLFPHIYFENDADNNLRILTVNQWGDIDWKSFEKAFLGCGNLQINALDTPDLNDVADMSDMFTAIAAINQDISGWDVSNVTNMASMFSGVYSFNQNISGWNVSKVTNMSGMFGATAFNQNIGSWDVSKVTSMQFMFFGTTAFNQSLAAWGTKLKSDVNLENMLDNCGMSVANYDATLIGFNQGTVTGRSLGAVGLKYCESQSARTNLITNKGWTITGDALASTCLPDINVKGNSQTIVNGDNTPVSTDHTDFGPVTVASGSVTRTFTIENPNTATGNLILGTITGGTTDFVITQPSLTTIPAGSSTTFTVTFDPTVAGKRTTTISIPSNDPDENPYTFALEGHGGKPFITTWKTDNVGTSNSTSITIPTIVTGYNYDVDWNNDGIFDEFGITGNVTHDYGTAGTYTVAIRGDFPRIHFNSVGDASKLVTISQWGDIAWTSMASAFNGCNNLTVSATDVPNLSGVSSLSSMFTNCTTLNGPANIGSWNTSTITSMSRMFQEATSFNQNISNWDVSNVINMSLMFQNATAFDQSLAAWGTKLKSDVNLANMLDNCGMSVANYDATLIGFNQGTATGRSLGAAGLKYCTAVADRNSLLTTKNWTITGDAQDIACSSPDYTITTTSNAIVVTDAKGAGETLEISENSGKIRFNVTGKTYSIDGGLTTAFTTPAEVALASKTSIVINAAVGNDIINVGAFTTPLPSLTINGGTGDDAVNFNGNIIFTSNANLDLDLQNDDANAGTDAVLVANNVTLTLSGTGTATVKVSKNVTLNTGSSLLTQNGNLVVEANQQAAPSTGDFAGINVAGGTLKVTGSGQATLKGKGGTTFSKSGVSVSNGGVIEGGTAAMSVIGTGGVGSGNENIGVLVTGTNSKITSSGGNVSVTGQGAGVSNAYNQHGVVVKTGGMITAGAAGTVTVQGTGATQTNSDTYGVYLDGGTITSSGGNVSVTGLGGGNSTSNTRNHGLYLLNAALLSAGGTGTVTANGTGGNGTSGDHQGIFVVRSAITSNNGDINLIGQSGGASDNATNRGIVLDEASRVAAGGTGSVSIEGTGTSSTQGFNYGVQLDGSNCEITTNNGNIRIIGRGGQGIASPFSNATGNTGVGLGGNVIAGGTGTIYIEGTGASQSFSDGVEVGRGVSTNDGTITILGVGGANATAQHGSTGVDINGTITAGNGKAITIQGTAGSSTGSSNIGVYIRRNISSTTGGSINVTGIEGGSGVGIEIESLFGGQITTATAGGDITFIANSINLKNTADINTNASSTVTLRPYTNGVSIDLGGATDALGGPLSLSDAELDRITAGKLQIGDVNSGAITISTAISRAAATNVNVTTAGAVNLNTSAVSLNGGNLVVNALGGVNPTAAGTDVNVGTVSFTSGNDLPIVINGTTTDTDYRQLKVEGSVNLSGLDLVLSGSHVPTLGQSFVIVNNDGSDAIQGTFNGLPEGATIASFLGSQLNARISYSGGDGNDAVLTVIASVELPTNTANATICKNATASLNATCRVGQETWYNSAGTTQLFVGSTFVTPLLSASTGYKVRCELASQLSGFVDVMVTVVVPPTITLTTLQQTLNEGNNPVLCDTDANPVNSLQFTVSGLCVSGNPVWRVQVGNGAWSAWSTSQPVSQLSNNQPHRYQAACDGNCTSTYSGVIELTINNRATVPQNVSLVVDGVTVAVGESKEVCSLVTIPLTFNANCAAGEVTLYSVDGGEYSSGVPTGLVDNQFHNYRVRCRKSDGTPSCVESESGVMRLKLVTIPSAPTVSLSSTSSCDATASFSGLSNCGSLRTVWYNATTNVALPNLPSTVPSQTTSYYARCQTENGCVSEKSNVVTFTLTPTQVAPVITASQEIVCTGTSVTISANCPAGSQTFWNTGVTTPSFEVSFNNVTKQTYWAKCIFAGGCQSSESTRKDIYWNAFVVTLINVRESKSSVKVNDRSAWTSQFIKRDGGPELEQSTQVNPTLYFVENVNKVAPRYWTINVEACGLSTDGSLTFDMLATPEMGVIRSFNTHENNAPYFMYANREGWTELYAQNHPAYGFYQDNGAGGNVYDSGLPKGLYKLGIRYWDMKGWGSIYPSTRKPQGNVLAYQEYWFRIQSKDGVGVGAARTADSGEKGAANLVLVPPLGRSAARGRGLLILPNPVTNILRLQVQDRKGQEVKAILLDAAGREVLSRKFVPETNMHHEEFGVSLLANGLYFLQVQTFEQQATLKVVKNE